MTPEGKEVVALVPMKGHSERVMNKNMRDFNGKPLLWHILNTLTHCEFIKAIYVDTDSDLIVAKVQQYFQSVHIIERPLDLCGDNVSMNAILAYDMTLISDEFFLQTHTTNPLLKVETIDAACREFFAGMGEYDSLFSVNRIQTRLYDENGYAVNHDPARLIRTQDLPPLYEENSNLYIFSRTSFEQAKARIGKHPKLYVQDPMESVDIDTESDFRLAEYLQRMTKEEKNV